MKLTQIAAKPQLIKITLDDSETVTEFGEALDFWIYDRQPMAQFVRLAQMKSENFGDLVEVINTMVLDEDATPVVKDGLTLPTHVMTKVISKVVETLGK
jgi:hypothetical protein